MAKRMNNFTVDSDILTKKYNQTKVKANRDAVNMTYVFGKNYTITAAQATLDPDNRIPVPLAQAAITNIIGYAGRPGQVKTAYKLVDPITIDGEKVFTDEITDRLNEYDKYNEEGIENSELMTQSLSTGDSYELWWVSMDDDGQLAPDYKMLPYSECCPVYNNSLKPEMIAFIRFQTDDNDDEIADIYYPRRSERWVRAKKAGAADTVWQRDTSGDTVYPYEQVPVIHYKTSMHSLPVFNAQKPLIDAFDQLISKTQNEVDRYNALITLFPGQVDAEFIRQLTEFAKPFISDLSQYDPSEWPRYLEKNLSGVNQFYNDQSDRLERLFHKTINIPDMSDEQFAGAQSGVAIAYKLIGFEFLVSEIEIYFRQGMAKRLDMYFDFINNTSARSIDRNLYEQEITWKRNIPIDDRAKVEVAAMLMGLGVSEETILRYLPSSIIDDAKKELERMEANESNEPGLPDNTNPTGDDE